MPERYGGRRPAVSLSARPEPPYRADGGGAQRSAFLRTRNTIRLTPAGQVLQEGLRQIYGDYRGHLDRVEAVNAGVLGELRLGLLEEQLLPAPVRRALRHVETEYPNMKVRLSRHSFRAAQSPERLSMIMMEMGIFERYQLLLGFEDALCSFYEYPDEAGEILEALTQFKLQLVDRIMEHLKPDVVMYMDDLGTQNAPLVAPALWAEFIRARDMRIFRAIHDAGALVVYHCCGKIDTFFDQIVTMGADAYHSVQPANDTAMLKRVYGDQIVLIGGIDNQGITNQPGASEADIRAEVRRAIDAFAPGGEYICGDTDGICVVKRALDIIQDEYEVYGRHYYERRPL